MKRMVERKERTKKGLAMVLCLMLCLALTGAAVYAQTTIETPNPAYSINGYKYQKDDVLWFKSGEAAMIKAPANYKISSASVDETFSDSISVSEGQENNTNPTFYLSNGIGITAPITASETLRWDDGLPTGSITLKADGYSDKGFENFEENPVFNSVYMIPVTVSLSAHDDDSGVESIQYYVAEEAILVNGSLTSSEIESKIGNGWSFYAQPFQLTSEELSADRRCIVYAKITDNVGNVSYLSSEGIAIRNWGAKKNIDGVINYVSSDGTTSAEISETGKTWLKEDTAGSSFWFALEGLENVQEKGWRFWIKALSKTENPDAWNAYCRQLDFNYEDTVEQDHILIFLTGVCNAVGREVTQFDKPVSLYIQLPDQWDQEDIKAVFIGTGSDEYIRVDVASMTFPEGSDTFAKLELQQFSPCAVYDFLTASEKALQNNSGNNQGSSKSQYDDTEKQGSVDGEASKQTPQSDTGDQRDMLLWVMLASIAIMLAAGTIITRKGRV